MKRKRLLSIILCLSLLGGTSVYAQANEGQTVIENIETEDVLDEELEEIDSLVEIEESAIDVENEILTMSEEETVAVSEYEVVQEITTEEESAGTYFNLTWISTSILQDGVTVHIVPEFSTDWTSGYRFTYMVYDLEECGWYTLKESTDEFCDWVPEKSGDYWIHIIAQKPDGNCVEKTVGYHVENEIKITDLLIETDESDEWNTPVYLSGSVENRLHEQLTYEYLVYDGYYWTVIDSSTELKTVEFVPEDSILYTFCFQILDDTKTVIGQYFSQYTPKDAEISTGNITVDVIGDKKLQLSVECETNDKNAEYRWMYYDIEKNQWWVIQDWSNSKETVWNVEEYGVYWIHVEGRTSNGVTSSTTIGQWIEKIYININGINMEEENGNVFNLDANIETNDTSAKYRWLYYDLAAEEWGLIQDWSSETKAVWKTTEAGTYWVHLEGKGITEEVVTRTIGHVVKPISIELKNLQVEKDGNTRHLSVTTESNGTNIQYRWMYYDLAAKEWGLIQEWSEHDEVEWNPLEPGVYWIHVEAKEDSGKPNQLTVGYVVDEFTLSLDDISVEMPSEKVLQLNVKATTDAPSIEYRWMYYELSTNSWGLIQDWSAKSDTVWKPTEFGSYWIHVEARTSTGTIVQKTIGYVVEEFYITLDTLDVSTEDWVTYQIHQNVTTNDPNIRYIYMIYDVALEQWITLGTEKVASWTPAHLGSYWVHVIVVGSDGSQYVKTIGYEVEEKEEGYIWPLPGYTYISSYFGYRTAPTSGASTYHQGIDIPAPGGTGILACASGTVTESGYTSSRGYYVEIDHNNGTSTIYMHMKSAALVKTGATVSQRQVIGYVGTTGISTGNHLHLSFLVNGVNKNPLDYIEIG